MTETTYQAETPSWFGRLSADRKGATAVVIGLSMTVVLGFVGLAVDVGLWYSDRRAAQGAADAAAYSAAIDMAAGDTASGTVLAAKAITARYSLTDGVGGVMVTVNTPPATGSHTATPGAVEVIVKKAENVFFSAFFLSAVNVSARAVAVAGSGTAQYCVLALDVSPAGNGGAAAVNLNNGASVDLTQCGLQVNDSGAYALYVTGGAHLDAKTLSVVGNYSANNGAHVNVSGVTTVNAPAASDPYGAVAVPAPGACAGVNTYGSGGTFTVSPGTYCNGLNIGNGARVTMNPGVYVIDRGSFNLGGGSKITATSGVTIVLTSSTGSNYATAAIGNGATFNITAPATGPTAGLAIMQDSRASGSTNDFAGGAQMSITGALYFPSELVNFSNGSSNGSSCTQLVAYKINYSGGSKFSNSCVGVGVAAIGSSGARNLVE